MFRVVVACLVCLICLAYADITPANTAVAPVCRQVKASDVAPVAASWITPNSTTDREKLDAWCESVGPAVFRAARQAPNPNGGRILVVDWNAHVGNADIQALIRELTNRELDAGRGHPDFVFLLQEVFRRSSDVPSKFRLGSHVPSRIEPGKDDIETIANELDWWMFYAPSMRNGSQNDKLEDRGNAILSSLPLGELKAIELPFSVQRRVAVSALVEDQSRSMRVRVATLHLDTRAPLSRGFLFGAAAARKGQAKWLAENLTQESVTTVPLILGGDLNSYWGRFESSVDTFAALAPHIDCGSAATHASGFTLDHIFARMTPDLLSDACSRAQSRFESDHYPLVLPLNRRTLPIDGAVAQASETASADAPRPVEDHPNMHR